MIQKYESVSLRLVRRGKCPCGKRVQRSTINYQTLSPFNKIGERLKTREEIQIELRAWHDRHKDIPVHCWTPGFWQLTEEQRIDYKAGNPVLCKADCGEMVIVHPIDVV